MEGKKRYNFVPNFTLPVLKKSKSGWRVEFYYVNSEQKKVRTNIKCSRYRKQFCSDKAAADWIEINIIRPLSTKLIAGWTPENDISFEQKKNSFIELSSKKVQNLSNVNVLLKKCFKEENLKNYSSTGWAADTEQLLTLISDKKKAGEYVKEMYEDNGVFYLLFHKDNKDRKSDKE